MESDSALTPDSVSSIDNTVLSASRDAVSAVLCFGRCCCWRHSRAHDVANRSRVTWLASTGELVVIQGAVGSASSKTICALGDSCGSCSHRCGDNHTLALGALVSCFAVADKSVVGKRAISSASRGAIRAFQRSRCCYTKDLTFCPSVTSFAFASECVVDHCAIFCSRSTAIGAFETSGDSGCGSNGSHNDSAFFTRETCFAFALKAAIDCAVLSAGRVAVAAFKGSGGGGRSCPCIAVTFCSHKSPFAFALKGSIHRGAVISSGKLAITALQRFCCRGRWRNLTSNSRVACLADTLENSIV